MAPTWAVLELKLAALVAVTGQNLFGKNLRQNLPRQTRSKSKSTLK